MRIGIPRSLFYYYYGQKWELFFKELNFDIVISPKTNKQIEQLGQKYANDEMCLSMKNYIGHVGYLKDKCDYIVIPRIDNYGRNNQTCTNFLAAYDIINNIFDLKILNYNIDIDHGQNEKKGFIQMATQLGIYKNRAKFVYDKINEEFEIKRDRQIIKNISMLRRPNLKVLLVGHPYNLYDEAIGIPIIEMLKKMKIEILYSDLFYQKMVDKLSKRLSKELYFKYSKENIGAIELVKEKIDGIIFLTTFPCGPDSLVNELVIRKLNVPYLNLIVDELYSMAGLETRLESFCDILERKKENV